MNRTTQLQAAFTKLAMPQFLQQGLEGLNGMRQSLTGDPSAPPAPQYMAQGFEGLNGMRQSLTGDPSAPPAPQYVQKGLEGLNGMRQSFTGDPAAPPTPGYVAQGLEGLDGMRKSMTGDPSAPPTPEYMAQGFEGLNMMSDAAQGKPKAPLPGIINRLAGLGPDAGEQMRTSAPPAPAAPAPTPAAAPTPQTDLKSWFSKIHGTAYDPNSKVDAAKLKYMEGMAARSGGAGTSANAFARKLYADPGYQKAFKG